MPPKSITLTDPETGATARVLLGLGFNCYECRFQGEQGPIDVLWSHDAFESGRERASGSGIPILFPFPGRLPGNVFHWRGRPYLLEPGDGRGNAIHGFVLNRPWRLLEQSASRAVGQFQAAVDAAELLQIWPADFRLTVTYELVGNSLRCELVADNPDDTPLPCGLGTHPYFRIPLGGPSGEECVLKLPVTRQWDLVDMLPTGQQRAVTEWQNSEGVPLRSAELDHVFSGLKLEDQRCTTAIEDPTSGVRLVQQFDGIFRECVVYTPPHRQAVCIEPYTCVPGAQELQAQDGLDAGFRVLEPGDAISACVEIRLESLPSS